jgi:hypothetical protein
MKNLAGTTINKPNNEDLQTRVLQLEQENAELTVKVQLLEEKLLLHQRKRFGASSERTHPGQLHILVLPKSGTGEATA